MSRYQPRIPTALALGVCQLAFFPTWLPLLRLLPQDRVVPFLEAIVEYATHSTVPKFSTETEKAVFASIRRNV